MLTPKQSRIHDQALNLTRRHLELEQEILLILREVESEKIFQALGYSSLFVYCVRALELTESVAYAFIKVMRKARDISGLDEALRAGEVSVAKASRFVAALTSENAEHLVEFAKIHSTREVEQEAAQICSRENPTVKLGRRKIEISLETLKLLKRAQDLYPALDIDRTLHDVLAEHLRRHDPVEKARNCERSHSRPQKAQAKGSNPGSDAAASQAAAEAAPPSRSAGPSQAPQTSQARKRVRLPAEVVHALNLRDEGRCTFFDSSGRRCENQRYLHVHHLKRWADGGSNDLDNLCLLCSEYHALVHQMSFGLDGQVSWLRETTIAYS